MTALYPVGTTTIAWNVTDANGNAATAVTQTVVVTDNQIPVIASNGDKNVNTDLDTCGATVVVSASATDNCTVGTPTGVRSDAQALTALYPVGTTTIAWNVTDVNGNPAIAKNQTVTVIDNQKPVITTNGNKSVNNTPGVCGATVIVSASATDNCSVGTPTGVRSDSQVLTALYPVGTTIITWNVTDANGNTTTAIQNVIVKDITPPTIVCPANIVLSACQPTATWTTPVANDNCSGVTVAQTGGPASGSIFAYATTTTITYTATDAAGNTDTCSFTVTRKAALSATASSNNLILYYGYAGDQTAIVSTSVSGGTAPYTVTATMDRPLKCNIFTTAGDELWVPGTGTITSSNVNTVCPATGAGLFPSSTGNALLDIMGKYNYSVSVTLMADALITFTITDANGCKTTSSQFLKAEDVRCFAGNSTNTKITICHKTGNTKNPCVAICVDYAALQEHLDHGDYVGTCTKTCVAPTNAKQAIAEEGEVEETQFKVTAYPNPSRSQFTLLVEGGQNEKVEVLVYDMLARMVKRIEKTDGQPIQFGEELPRGEYLTIVKQGENMKAVNVIKQ